MGVFRKVRPSHVFTLLVSGLLLLHTFYPGLIHVDRYTAWFSVLLFMMVILPSLKKGGISYLFSFERDLKRARESVGMLVENDGAKDSEVKKKVRKKMSQATDINNACLTTGKIRDQIKKRLYESQRLWLKKADQVRGLSSEDLAAHLREKGVLSRELYEAVNRILTICTSVDYMASLKPKDVAEILETSLPILERLHELSKGG